MNWFVIGHPIISGIVIIAISIGLYLIIWRYIFPISWYMHSISQEKSKDELVKLGSRVAPALVRMIENINIEQHLRWHAAKILERIGWKPAGINEEIMFYIAGDHYRRLDAIGTQAIPFIVREKKLPSPYVYYVPSAIEKINDPTCIGVLIDCLASRHRSVRDASINALKAIDHPLLKPLITAWGEGWHSPLGVHDAASIKKCLKSNVVFETKLIPAVIGQSFETVMDRRGYPTTGDMIDVEVKPARLRIITS